MYICILVYTYVRIYIHEMLECDAQDLSTFELLRIPFEHGAAQIVRIRRRLPGQTQQNYTSIKFRGALNKMGGGCKTVTLVYLVKGGGGSLIIKCARLASHALAALEMP